MRSEVLAQHFAPARAPVSGRDGMHAAIVALWEGWCGGAALAASLPFQLDDVQDVVRGCRPGWGSVEGLQEGSDGVYEAHHADDTCIVRRLVLAHVSVVEREGAQIRCVFEGAEHLARLGTLKTVLADVDVADVLAHAADAVEEDFQVAETVEVEVVGAVENRGSLAEDLLAGAEESGEECGLLNPFGGLQTPGSPTHDRSSRFVDFLRGSHLDLALFGLHHVRVDMIADLWRKFHEAEALGRFQHEDFAAFVRTLGDDELQIDVSRCHEICR